MTETPKKIRDDDTELLEAITSGRDDLFPALLKRHEKRLYNFGLKICKDVSDAEDLVQETFIGCTGPGSF